MRRKVGSQLSFVAFLRLITFSSPAAADVAACFTQAFSQTARASLQTVALQIGDCAVTLRSASPTLLQQVLRPLACPVVAASETSQLTLDLVDLGEEPLPALPWPPQQLSREQETSEFHHAPYLFTRHGDVMLTVLNQATGHAVALVHAPEQWPLRHYKQAIFITLYQLLRPHGLYLIHASAIASAGRAALIAGRSGAGKTTTMLTAVSAGLDFLGDDTTLLQRTGAGAVDVVALMATMDVTAKTAAWFPALAPHLSDRQSHTGKRQMILTEAFPQQIAPRARVHAILAPEITDRRDTLLVPANKTAVLSELLFFSVDLQDPAQARRHLDFLAQLVEETPIYRLQLGSDRTQIPRVLQEALNG